MTAPNRQVTGFDPDVDLSNIPDPTAISWVLLSRINDEITMLMGHVNQPAAVKLLKGDPSPDERGVVKVPGKATHYVQMSYGAFQVLHKRVNEFAAKLAKDNLEAEASNAD